MAAIGDFGWLIYSIIYNNKPACEIFSSTESFSAILKCFHRSKTSNDASSIADSIDHILEHNPSSNKFLNPLPVVEAFSFIIPLAKHFIAVERISEALLKILNDNEEAQQKFATPEFLEIFRGMEKHATTYESNKQFQTVLELLMKN